MQGLRVQDIKEISPWEILEGLRHSGPLQLSWFGAVRMKRKPLKLVEQWRQAQFHTHQSKLEHMCTSQHFVSLPDACPPETSTPANSAIGTSSQMKIKQEFNKGPVEGASNGGPASSTGHAPALPPGKGGGSVAGSSGHFAPGMSSLASSTNTGYKEKITMVVKGLQAENQDRPIHGDMLGVTPLPPQLASPNMPPPMTQQHPRMHSSGLPMVRPMMGGGMQYPSHMAQQQQQQQQQHHRGLEVLHAYLTPQQKKAFPTCPPDEKKAMLIQARQRMQMRVYQQQQLQQQQQQQRMVVRQPMAMHGNPYRPQLTQSGPLHANPPMPMQQIIQQRQGFPGQQHHPGMQQYMMRQPMYGPQQPMGGPMYRPQHLQYHHRPS